MTAPGLATRVMKARRQTLCPACLRPVNVGALIAKTTLGWLHARCAITRQHDHHEETP